MIALNGMIGPTVSIDLRPKMRGTCHLILGHCGSQEFDQGSQVRTADLGARCRTQPRHLWRGRSPQISVVSASVNASSISTPRYLTVFSILVCPSNI